VSEELLIFLQRCESSVLPYPIWRTEWARGRFILNLRSYIDPCAYLFKNIPILSLWDQSSLHHSIRRNVRFEVWSILCGATDRKAAIISVFDFSVVLKCATDIFSFMESHKTLWALSGLYCVLAKEDEFPDPQEILSCGKVSWREYLKRKQNVV
jgi:hypothetical protein